MSLHDLEPHFTFRAVQELSFFHFVLVQINLGSAFWTPNHGEVLLEAG
jgi:hypothetical protein